MGRPGSEQPPMVKRRIAPASSKVRRGAVGRLRWAVIAAILPRCCGGEKVATAGLPAFSDGDCCPRCVLHRQTSVRAAKSLAIGAGSAVTRSKPLLDERSLGRQTRQAAGFASAAAEEIERTKRWLPADWNTDRVSGALRWVSPDELFR